MGLPNILINFKQKASTAIKRGQRGIVCVICKEAANTNVYELNDVTEVPEGLTQENKDYVSRAFLGGVNSVKKIIVVCTDTIANALNKVETLKFDYLCGSHDLTTEEATAIAAFIKGLRDNKNIKVKAVLPNIKGDHEGIINFTTDNIVVGEKTFTTVQYCSRIAGLLAGTPLQQSCTYYVLPEVTDVPKFTKAELDAKINAGEFMIFHDGEKVKVARGINSLTTLGAAKTEDMKFIKIIDIMDIIYTDIKKTAEDGYVGKYPNNYDNKVNLMIAIEAYLETLRDDELLDKDVSVSIDIQAQTAYLKSIGVDVSSLNEQEIKQYNTKTNVFIAARFKILNAIEDITLNCYI